MSRGMMAISIDLLHQGDRPDDYGHVKIPKSSNNLQHTRRRAREFIEYLRSEFSADPQNAGCEVRIHAVELMGRGPN